MKRASLLLLAGCASSVTYSAETPAWVSDTSTFGTAPTRTLAATYQDTAARIIAAARADRGAYDKLSVLTDMIGARPAGSPSLDHAVAWAASTLRDDGLDVHTEPVMVPRWVRNTEEAALVAPVARPLTMLGLGNSVGTPPGGLSAPAIVVHSFDELQQRRSEVSGKVVVFNAAMPAWSSERGSGYGDLVTYRTDGASRAARYGAVAVLVRSVTATSLATVHTGSMSYDADAPRIPAASITVEDAELLDRLAAQGKVPQIRLRMGAQTLPDVESANVVAELRGRERPDEIVLLAAHTDSWDVGQGAQDDGAGVVTMMQALRVLKTLGLTPRRTIRVVLYTGEENGRRGGKAYAAAHAAELPRHVAALESDSGGFAPIGFGVEHADPVAATRARARVAEIASLLAGDGLDARRVSSSGGGPDISALGPAGVPLLSLDVDNRTYFDVHHSRADTLDKVSPQSLADMTAVAAVFAYIVADMPDRLDADVSTSSPVASPYDTRAPSPGTTPSTSSTSTDGPPWDARTPPSSR